MIAKDCVVYWLFDGTCICPWRHGYIGLTTAWKSRLKNHRNRAPFQRDFRWQILFRGTRQECRHLEYKLRPDFNIGWNRNPGGMKSPRLGVIIPEHIRQRMSEARKRWLLTNSVSAETRIKLSIANTGRSNKGRIGQKKSDEERQRISHSHLGKKASGQTRRQLSMRMLGNSHHRGHDIPNKQNKPSE